MRVNVVCKPGWILERLARELAARLPDVSVNAGKDRRVATPRAHLNYYLPTRDYHKYPADGVIVGLYTHGDTGFDLIPRLSAAVAMNQTMGKRLRDAGAPHVRVIRPGVDRRRARPIVFGVIGRVYNNRRKGEHLVAAAVAAGYHVVACGPSARVSAMSAMQWPVETVYGFEDRDAFYQSIDYLLVTSTEEGGPMTVPEAIDAGVPVIAPKGVGWCDEFDCLGRYEAGSWPALHAVLQRLTEPPTWDAWADGHRALFQELREVAA